jgi:hypothetical protein
MVRKLNDIGFIVMWHDLRPPFPPKMNSSWILLLASSIINRACVDKLTGKLFVFDVNFFHLASERRVAKGKTDGFYINPW